MFATGNPTSKESLSRCLSDLNQTIATYANEFPLAEFFQPQEQFWSPAEHIRHLVKTVRPVAAALKIPKFILLLKFKRPKRKSRSFQEIRQLYHDKLKGGAKAGRFAPGKNQPLVSKQEWREEIVKNWQSTHESLIKNMASWSERDLDNYILPHPILGKLTVREMLFFTLYHNKHHVARIEERRKSKK